MGNSFAFSERRGLIDVWDLCIIDSFNMHVVDFY